MSIAISTLKHFPKVDTRTVKYDGPLGQNNGTESKDDKLVPVPNGDSAVVFSTSCHAAR